MPPSATATAATTPAMTSASNTAATNSSPIRKSASGAEKKYKCQFCNRAFSRSEHRSRHERSHTKERPFKCMKCRSTFVRRDLLLRHDRTVHAKDGGAPLSSEGRRKSSNKRASSQDEATSPTFANNANNNNAADSAAAATASAAAMNQHHNHHHHHLDGSDDMVDIETAAMLMTDFHHKAMASQDPELHASNDLSVISPTGASLLPYPSNPYGPDAVALPEMPWDSLVPHSSDGKPRPPLSGHHQISQDQMSFSSTGMSNPLANHMPPMLGGGGPAATASEVLQPITGGLSSLSDIGTPGALSPFASMMGPVSPVDYRRSPGPSQALTIRKAPQISADEQCARILENIKRCDLEVALLETFRLPNRTVLNHYLQTYFTLFHHHLPFLHPATFDPTEVAAPLLLAVLSIGALYTFEQDQAFMLHIGSKVLVNQFLQKKENVENFSSRKCPLWTMQSTLLNMIFASWSGDPKGLEFACSIKSLLANMVAGNRYELKLRKDSREGALPTYEEWIEDEGCRRSYYAVYIFFGMLTLTYNHTPAISFNELDSLELPSTESLWSMEAPPNADTWRDKLSSYNAITFREAHDKLFQGETATYSAFGTRVMINALFLEVWYHKRSPEALQDVVMEWKLRLALETWEKSLELCQPETVVVQLNAPHRGHPLIFNAMAMYRNTRARLLVDLKSIQEALRYHDSFEVAAAMTNARGCVKRSDEMIKVIQACFDCVEVAAQQGIRWVARTSATNWSVEHPLCGLDLIVILSLWLWRIEHDEEPANEEEMNMYSRLRSLFDEDSVDVYGTKLSATVARLWGSMIDEVVVWGITKLIGESFKLHAQALIGYEDSLTPQQEEATSQRDVPLASHPVEVLEMQTAY